VEKHWGGTSISAVAGVWSVVVALAGAIDCTGVPRELGAHAGTNEGAQFISWRWRGRDHGEF
jgi:hypothetical protein